MRGNLFCSIIIIILSISNLKAQDNSIRCVKLEIKLPIQTHDSNKIDRYKTFTQKRYSYQDLVLYEKGYSIITQDEIAGKVIEIEDYIYFLYKKGTDSGFNSKTPKELFKDKITVDSFLNENGLDSSNLGIAPFFKASVVKQVYAKYNTNSDSLEEAYHLIPIVSPTNSIDCILRFKKIMFDEGLCLSDSLNKAKQMHLYSFKLTFNAGVDRGHSFNTFSIEKQIQEEILNESDQARIKKLFESYDLLFHSR